METYNHTYRHHNFSHKDLSDLTFTACTFIRSDFRRANLRDTTFVNCKFIEQGDIEGCHFDVAVFVMQVSNNANLRWQTSVMPIATV